MQNLARHNCPNETTSKGIELHAYHDGLVLKGLEEMRKGDVIAHEAVIKRLKKNQ